MKRQKLTACAALLFAIGSLWYVQRARAELGERALGLGRTLGSWLPAGADTALELNGQVLHLATQSSDDDVSRVLDRFESDCGQSALQPVAATPPPNRAWLSALRQDFGEQGGVAVCLAQARPSAGLDELLRQFATYAQSGQLGQFGLRYLFVRRTPRGSHSLLVWNAGPLSLRAMFPERGDAAGSDLPTLPRPARARRILSAQVQARGYALAVYELADAPRSALAQYTRALVRLGYRDVQIGRDSSADQALAALARGPERVVVQSFRQDGQSVLALVRMGDGAPSEESTDVR